jgi:hypothetical protein
MRTFQNTYLSERDIDDKTVCLFFFNQYGSGGEENRNADGFMPRGKQFGYMFTKGFASANDLYIGAAHELGHGMFLLKHPFDNDYKIPARSTDNLMDYANGIHIAKWQWDLIHDPGVIVRVFERDEDAMKHQDVIKNQEYFIRDGKVNTNALVYKYPSVQNMLKTKTFQSFISKFDNSSNISNLIFETMGPVQVASTGISFITNVLRNDKWEVRLLDIKQLTEEQYKTAKIALRIWYIKSFVDYNDIPFAHELFMHGIAYIDEINKLDLTNMNLEQVKKKIPEIMDKAYYYKNNEDTGDKDHALFLTGKKEEMTNYLLERLESMKTDSERWEYLYKIIKGDEGSMYNYIIDTKSSSNLVNHYQGGRKQLIKDTKKYLEEKFSKYHDLIFKPFQGKTQSLWKEIDSTYPH